MAPARSNTFFLGLPQKSPPCFQPPELPLSRWAARLGAAMTRMDESKRLELRRAQSSKTRREPFAAAGVVWSFGEALKSVLVVGFW